MNCTHSSSAHNREGDRCAYCGTRLTLAMIAAAVTDTDGSPQAARPGGEPPTVPAGQVPSGAPSAPARTATSAPPSARRSSRRQGLPEPGRLFDPAARFTDPITSHQAAASITPDARRDAHRAVLLILANGPASDFDLAAATGLKQTSIDKRRGELRDVGYVRGFDRAGVSDTGSACIRWTLTRDGWAEADRLRKAAA